MKDEAREHFKEILERVKAREIEKYGRVLTDEKRDAIDEEEEREREDERKKEFIRERFTHFLNTVPPRYIDSTFDSFEGCEDKIEFLKKGKSAILFGGNGTGKTHLGYAYCRYFAEQGKRAMFVMAYKFFDDIKRSFEDNSTSKVLGRYKDLDYLVIDEIDKSYGSPTEFVHLYHLVNERYNHMLPTVLITNAKREGLTELLGVSVLDRIASEGATIEMKGDNYRKKIGVE